MAFQTTRGMYRPTRLVQGATNLVSAFVRLTRKILSPHLGSIAEVFIDDIGVKGPRSRYNDEEVEPPVGLPAGLPGVRYFILEHLQNLDKVLIDVERARGKISGEKSDWGRNGVKIGGFVGGEAGRWPQASKIERVANWPPYGNRMECRAFLGQCTYYRIWIPDYVVVARPLFQILRKDKEFVWETNQQKAMKVVKDALISAPALRILDVEEEHGQIVTAVDASLEEWGAILQQDDEEGDRHPCRY